MRIVAASKTTGAGEKLWPKGMSAEDIPADLFEIINHSLDILFWQENLTKEEMPPHWMWHLDWELESWFITVKNNRAIKYGDPSPEVMDEGYERNELYDEFFKDD